MALFIIDEGLALSKDDAVPLLSGVTKLRLIRTWGYSLGFSQLEDN